jgi:hypothetical protein
MSNTDNELIFKSIQKSHLSGWYYESPYKTLGCILHWLCVFGLIELKEQTIITNDEIICDGDIILKYTWDDQFLMPVFQTINAEYFFIEEKQMIFIEQAKLKANVVLEHLTLPDRGFRFWSQNTDNNTKLYTGEIVYSPILYTDDNDEAIQFSRYTNSKEVASFSEMMKYYKNLYKNYYDEEETTDDILD